MISLDDMMVFARVVELRSFTNTADELGIGKARVSQIVSRLESQLGTRLLNRTTRSLSLTDTGQQYFEKCVAIRAIAVDANTESTKSEQEPQGLIRVSVPLGNNTISSLLSGFLHRYPLIQLDILESDRYSDLIESRCDVAIRASASLEDSSLYAMKIGEVKDIICASAEYVKSFGKIRSTKDLQKLDWISHEVVHGDKHLTLSSPDGKSTRLNHKPRVLVRSTNTLRGLIKNHIGFGILPDFMIREELEKGELVQLLPEVHQLKLPFYAVYQEKQLMPLRIRVFLDYLKTNRNFT